MGRPAVADAPPVATTERIAAAAELEFARCGFDRARLEDVARRAGIRRPSLLYHYPTKQVLYEAVVRRVFADLESILEAALATPATFGERLDALVRAFSGYLDANPRFAALVLRELMDGRGQGRELLRSRLVPTLDTVVAAVRAAAGPHLPPGFPVRDALLQLASGILLHAAAGSLRDPLWRGEHDPVALGRRLLQSSEEVLP